VIEKLEQSQMGLVSLEDSAIEAFTSVVRRDREDAAHADRATARAQVILSLQKLSPPGFPLHRTPLRRSGR